MTSAKWGGRRKEETVIFLSQWIALKKRDHTIEDLFDYRILGNPLQQRSWRWSVVKGILGWVE